MQTKHFCAGDLNKARVLVIGHDPRLRKSETQAEYALFANYFLKPRPTHKGELAKYRLAEAVYGYIGYLTSYRYVADQLIVTNLCNSILPSAPKGRTVLIPEREAQIGVDAIQGLLKQSKVEIIFAMSLQVNYWLQKLNFYKPITDFLAKVEPKDKGIRNIPPYYEPRQNKAFQLVCGKIYACDNRKIVPILHIKNWPLRGAFAKAYESSYEDCINNLKGID